MCFPWHLCCTVVWMFVTDTPSELVELMVFGDVTIPGDQCEVFAVGGFNYLTTTDVILSYL